ncbi:hypothetical protein ECEPECA14_3024 [Escherichia coli EPECa14]|nr:hypothetical protein ECEPECA14_3024 [Escherichia coli EPECa14]EHW68897.1 hypothetical protein ECDEC10C_5167 [Escherichia coli DEC10C]
MCITPQIWPFTLSQIVIVYRHITSHHLIAPPLQLIKIYFMESD